MYACRGVVYAWCGVVALLTVVQVATSQPPPCFSAPCLNNGTCAISTKTSSGYVCRCPPEYQGSNCQDSKDKSPCACQNGGLCRSYRSRSFWGTRTRRYCQCPKNYYGRRCENEKACVRSNPCQNGGTCMDWHAGHDYDDVSWWRWIFGDDADDYKCMCPANYEGRRCEKESVCMRNSTCVNGGQCVPCSKWVFPRGFYCECKDGYYGSDCEKERSCVKSNPCQNGGSCINLHGRHGYKDRHWWWRMDHPRDYEEDEVDFKCQCPANYVGERCEQESACMRNSTCQNGGQCIPCSVSLIPRGFYCQCKRGFYGRDCEKPPACLDDNPCQNGGTCKSLYRGRYRCICPNMYYGRNCQMESPCRTGNPCTNGGTCRPLPFGHYHCRCADSYFGHHCEREIPCMKSNPCENGGTCRAVSLRRYHCICPKTHTGLQCQIQSPCVPNNPCLNGGRCIGDRYTAFYRCFCQRDYYGKNCEKASPCSSKPCQNGGRCIRCSSADYCCVCPYKFYGKNCEKERGCGTTNPCLNGGTCRPGLIHDGFRCMCRSGYRGRTCDVLATPPVTAAVPPPEVNPSPTGPPLVPTAAPVLDVCENHLCENGAICRPFRLAQRGYICTCQVGFTGVNCQEKTKKQRESLSEDSGTDVFPLS